MRYYVTYSISARYVAEVCAKDIEEAKKLADDAWNEADFGEAQDIDAECVMIESENTRP